jgi:2-polyprenyl-6-hydroxyphenyl methylase / 3-demethylubiquinone-9 3-methyltransferase
MFVRNDLNMYEANAAAWWSSAAREFRSLRSVGEFHLGLIDQFWGAQLQGARVVELGCGGGWLALELDARGAHVSAVDRSQASLVAARQQALNRCARARFFDSDLHFTPFPSAQFDFCVMTDVLEHLTDPAGALREVGRLLKPGGQLFVNTFDRHWLSAVVVVHLAEGLGIVPRGTHDPKLFVRPSELAAYGHAADLESVHLGWEQPRLWQTLRTRVVQLRAARRGLGYHALLQKRGRA